MSTRVSLVSSSFVISASFFCRRRARSHRADTRFHSHSRTGGSIRTVRRNQTNSQTHARTTAHDMRSHRMTTPRTHPIGSHVHSCHSSTISVSCARFRLRPDSGSAVWCHHLVTLVAGELDYNLFGEHEVRRTPQRTRTMRTQQLHRNTPFGIQVWTRAHE
jgi:hypothetical protein